MSNVIEAPRILLLQPGVADFFRNFQSLRLVESCRDSCTTLSLTGPCRFELEDVPIRLSELRDSLRSCPWVRAEAEE